MAFDFLFDAKGATNKAAPVTRLFAGEGRKVKLNRALHNRYHVTCPFAGLKSGPIRRNG